MPPKIFEVYKFQFQFGVSLDRRPWILVREPFVASDGKTKVLMYGCSTRNYGPSDFVISKEDPDFPATGLTAAGNAPKDNYVDYRRLAEIPAEIIGPRKGVLTGDLLRRFKAWAKMP